MPELIDDFPLIDEALKPYAESLGSLYPGCRSHAYRMLNFARALAAVGDDPHTQDERIAIVAALHDLPGLLDGNLDYVVRGGDLAAGYAREYGRAEWERQLRLMAENHHKLRRYDGPHANLVEAVRKADWIDITMGQARFGLPRPFVREVVERFPMTSLYPVPACRLMVRHAMRNPRRPLPMLRW